MAAAAAPATAASAAEGRKWPGVEGRFLAGIANPGEHRYSPFGWLLAIGTVGSSGAHWLKLIELVAASGAVIFVNRHRTAPRKVYVTGNLTHFRDSGQANRSRPRVCSPHCRSGGQHSSPAATNSPGYPRPGRNNGLMHGLLQELGTHGPRVLGRHSLAAAGDNRVFAESSQWVVRHWLKR